MIDISKLIERSELLSTLGLNSKSLWRAIQRREIPEAIKTIGRKKYWNRDVTTWRLKNK